MTETCVTASDELVEANDWMVAYSPVAGGVAFTTNAHRASGTVPGATTPALDRDGEDGDLGGNVAMWGKANDLPKQIVLDVERNPELASVLDWKMKALIGGGLVYGYVTTDPVTGKERMEVANDPDVEEWLRRSNIKLYLRDLTKDFYVLWLAPTEVVLNEAGDYVACLAAQDASYFRYGLQDAKGQLSKGYLCAEWDKVSSTADKRVSEFPLLDPHYDVQAQLEGNSTKRWLYVARGTSTGRTYYPPAPWHSLRVAGWLELANSIPKFKKALLRNQFTIKYHVEIPDWWWKLKYPDWEQKDKLKRERVQAELQAFNKKMAGEDNAGNNIVTMLKTDEATGKTWDGWRITPIKDELKDGKYIEDSQEASSHVFFGTGVDPTLIGAAPGKTFSSGSGSDKRVAQNIYLLNCKPEQDTVLEAVQHAFHFNKFGQKQGHACYTVWFRTYLVQTLDTGKPASSNSGKSDKNDA